MFVISCKTGNVGIKKTMSSLGASINVMSLSIYKVLNVDPLKETCVIIQLADRSVVYLEGVLEDILVKVNEIIFLANFYIINMEDDNSMSSSGILLGRLFLSTANTNIDVRSDMLLWNSTLKLSNLIEMLNVSNVDIIEPLTQEYTDFHNINELKTVLYKSIDSGIVDQLEKFLWTNLKSLLEHLKYVFLGEKDTLLVIVSSKLSKVEEENLVYVLRDYREVVKKVILKLLDTRMIYPISDSNWVSLVYVVPKRIDVAITKKSVGKLVPARIPIASNDQEKKTSTCPFSMFPYRRMLFRLCNALTSFYRCMVNIFCKYVEKVIEVFMDNFTTYGHSFDECLVNLTKILQRCLEFNLILNYKKCHFMVDRGLLFVHIVSFEGIEVDKAKTDVINSLPYPKIVREIRFFPCQCKFLQTCPQGFLEDFTTILSSLAERQRVRARSGIQGRI
ncbi:Retrovirus-related Pol polyprotein from transposon 17.6 [Gossypium australe]|uniref:Retrovirus-related Pol polyprotein from transposon 17.6 n=1 Tax=Gossypium australe TaxID=47621 RepID=A0A5B6W675_9ROSI|nr:Retrovirus-related Pol polyprotein from transposon 17.6 [Gossypium australe]